MSGTAADLIITHARVFTADPVQPTTEAVAVNGNRITAVGSAADLDGLRGANTRVIDAGGGTVTPGLIDSHYHLFFGSMELGLLDLWQANSSESLATILRQHAADHPDADSLHAAGLRYEIFPPGFRLTRHDLDEVVSDRPLLIMGYDHHNAWANTRALETAGVLHGAKTGPNSEILMFEDGTATGELVEPAAYALVLMHFPAWARTVKGLMGETLGKPRTDPVLERKWLSEGLKLAARYGITSVHNMDGDIEQAEFYAAMERDGLFGLRVNIPYSIFPVTPLDQLEEASEMARRFASGKVRSGRVKLFMDGVLESWTALMIEDYGDRPGWKGDSLYSVEHYNRIAVECDRRGLQITVHAIGDGAVRRTLDGFELARKTNGVRDSRHRVEHIEVIHPDDLPRFARLGVIASMQPYHAPYTYPNDPSVVPDRIGRQRWNLAYAWQIVRGAGAHLAFGSDFPIVSCNPMTGAAAALNRRAWETGMLDHRQSLHDILIGYTREGAYAEFAEGEKGQIKPGYLADLVLYPTDLFSTPPDQIGGVEPILTLCDGAITYQA